MCTKIYPVYGWKTGTESTNRDGFIYNELIGNSVFDLQIHLKKLRYLFYLNFLNNWKVISLHKVIRYVKCISSLSTISAQSIRWVNL